MESDENRCAAIGGEGTERGKAQHSAPGCLPSWSYPMSHLKTNSSKTLNFQMRTKTKNAKKANDSFKVTQWIRAIMWDYNSGLLFLNLVVFPGSREASCTWLCCVFLDGPGVWLPPVAGPTVLAKAQTAYLLIPKGKAVIQTLRSKNCRLSF